MIKVSIIVPVFNISKKLLIKCLDSLLSQSLYKIEIILVDDCSTLQETKEILNIYNNKYKQIKLITHAVNKRQGGARNSGIKVASGEYIGFVDADDYIDKNMYKLLYDKAIKEDADIVDCNLYHVDINDNIIKKEISIDINKNDFILNSGRNVTKIFRKNLILDNNIFFPENILYEDNAISGLHILYAKKVSKVEQYLYYYVRHSNSTVSDYANNLKDKVKAGKIFYNIMKKRGFLSKYKDKILVKYFQLYFKSTYRLIMKYDKDYLKILSIMLDELKSNEVDIQSNNIQSVLKTKEKFEICLLDNFPKIFQIYVDIKYNKYKE